MLGQIYSLRMNIYNLQDFKCGFCTKWFHPHNSVPFSLPCSHSICASCLKSFQKKSKTSLKCPYHNSSQSLANVKVNEHIQQALERLLKNTSSQSTKGKKIYQRKNELQFLLKEKEQDLHAFTQLLEQIYNNEINRILSLKKRVLREAKDSTIAFNQWNKLIHQSKDMAQIEEQGRIVEDKIRQFSQLNLQEMAQIIITDPAICLQRQFSIYNLIKKQQRKTLKSSIQQNERFPNKSLISSFIQSGKQNIYLNCIKTVDSPIKRSNNIQHCKQLSSFKLQDSQASHHYSRLQPERVVLKRVSHKQSEWQQNGETTLRDTEQFQSKVVIKEREKRMSDKFQDLISSLKSNKEHQELIYSPDNDSIEEELLLSNTKHDVNFLREHQFEHRASQRQIEVKQRPVISSQRQKNKYVKRMQTVRTEEAYYNTNVNGNTIELFNSDLKDVNLKAYLDKFDWRQIEVIKLIGTGLQDKQLNQLLNYMIEGKVHSLLLSNNQLQEISLDAILRFNEINKFLKTVSLQKNNIHQLHTNAKAKLALLKQRGVLVYI